MRHGLDERLEAIAEDCKREIMALVRAGKATLPAMEEIVQHHAARMDLLIADIPAALERAERHLSGDATQ